MEVVNVDPDEHDSIMAAVSHMPHMVAYTLMNTVASMKTEHFDDVLPFAAGGLRDITRIAGSDPVMWRDICLMNRDQLLALIDRFKANLDQLREAIEQGQGETMQSAFSHALENRRRLAGTNE
jgi:prephenate dehydrogenase